MKDTYTKRMFFNDVINANISEAVTEKAKTMLAQYEKEMSSKNKSNDTGKAEAVKKFIAHFGNDIFNVAMITKAGIAPTMSTSAITAVCKYGVDNGMLEKVVDFKENGKGAKTTGYKAIAEDNDSDEDVEG